MTSRLAIPRTSHITLASQMTELNSLKRPLPEKSPTLPVRTNKELYDMVKPEYIIEGDLRRVRPYHFEYQTYTKARWLGKPLLEVLKREFRDRLPAYYRMAIERGDITINGQPVSSPDYRLRPNDLLGHRLHRHEPPVTATLPYIIHDEEGMVVVDKPASVPVHPSGRYRFNTLVEIMRHEWMNLPRKTSKESVGLAPQHLSLINRLDRLVSGVCILATSSTSAEQLHRRMEEGHLGKEYVARVVGRFPDSLTDNSNSNPNFSVDKVDGIDDDLRPLMEACGFDDVSSIVVCDAPLRVVEHKLGLVAVYKPPSSSEANSSESSNVKPAKTIFRRLAFNGRESIVWCRPETGRTHQIRVHLQFLGHPIVNDPLYNHPIWKASSSKAMTWNRDELQQIARQLLDETIIREDKALTVKADDCGNSPTKVEGCPECLQPHTDPRPEDLCIYLHAWRYSSADWTFESKLPLWVSSFNTP